MKFDYDKVVEFIEVRYKNSGGFGATRRLPATIEDTCNALQSLAALRDLTGQDRLMKYCHDRKTALFLQSRLPGRGLGPRTIFQLYAAAVLMGLAFDRQEAAYTIKNSMNMSDTIGTYYACRLAEMLDLPGPSGLAPLAWPARRTCHNMLMTLENRLFNGEPLEKFRQTELVGWFKACQSPDGGFGFLPGTTSFIENTYFCLRALYLLEAGPQDAEAARQSVTCTQTGSGGFGRRGRAAPFLDSTRYALQDLVLLDKI